jgi:hypothetical protein
LVRAEVEVLRHQLAGLAEQTISKAFEGAVHLEQRSPAMIEMSNNIILQYESVLDSVVGSASTDWLWSNINSQRLLDPIHTQAPMYSPPPVTEWLYDATTTTRQAAPLG